MRQALLVILLCLVPQFGSFAQATKIDLNALDKEKLTDLMLDQVNVLRKRRRLDTLVQDDLLELAAQDHADYMALNDAIGHDQKSKIKRSPYNRVVYYKGAHNLVGENVLSYPLAYEINKSKGKLTYEKLAKELIDLWIKSKPHYKNLIEPNFKHIAHAITIKDGMIYACEVFANEPFESKYEFQEGSPIYTNNKKECYNCKQVKKKVNNDEVIIGWYNVSNDSVYYLNTKHYTKGLIYRKKKGKYLVNLKKNNLNQVFSAKGVIAVDVIHHEQFDCGGKTSFHNSKYHSGYHIGTVRKSDTKLKNLHWSNQMVKVFVGMKPAFVDTFYQVDLNLVKRNRFCEATSIIFVRPDYFEPKEYFKLPLPKIGANKNLIIEDSLLIKIPFERNQTDGNALIFNPLIQSLDSLVQNDHDISSIFFTGVASIEGTERENKRLFTKRGAIIGNHIKKYYPDVPFESEFYENFDDFKSGLVAVGYVDVTETSDDSLRLFANDNKDDEEIAAVLDQTRYSTVKINYRDYIPVVEGSYGLSVERIMDLIEEGNAKEILPLYLILGNKAFEGDAEVVAELSKIEFPETPAFAKLNWYQLVYELGAENLVVDAVRMNKLRENGGIATDADFLEYGLLFNLFNGFQGILIKDARETIDNMRGKKKKAWVESLLTIHTAQFKQEGYDAAAAKLVADVLKYKFDVTQTYYICQYLIEWGYTAEPYILLSKFAKVPNQFPKLYAQYLVLGYFLQEYNNAKEWKRIRVVMRNMAAKYPDEFCDLFKWNQMGVRSLVKKEIAGLFCEFCEE
ncbi:CAP domain-containing protein [Crocinitomix catalasitica]|uniref:CAP domain-containing protein n=1 Tax=Crocinitomix catalasitica TaxID=184607 RepID=UPI00048999DD|nr:CAP domain-containing protein [Crocinitomix catalasitica]